MIGDKKKLGAAVAAKMPPPGKLAPDDDGDYAPTDDMGEEDGKDAAETSAIGDMRAAFKADDDAAARAALKEFIELCYPSLKE